MCAQAVFPVIDLARTGRSIERHRREAGLTVRDLQAYFGFEYPQAIYKWQHGQCLPSVDNLLALARLLQVSMEDLLVFDDREVFHVVWAFGVWHSVPRRTQGVVFIPRRSPRQRGSRWKGHRSCSRRGQSTYARQSP